MKNVRVFLLIGLFFLFADGLNAGEGQILCAGRGGNVYNYSGTLPPAVNSFKQAPGVVSDIAISSDGQVIGIGTDKAIWYSETIVNGTSNFKKQEGTKATRLAAGGTNFIHVGTGGSMWFYSGKAEANGRMNWTKINGTASDVAIRADGMAMHVGGGNAIYYTPVLNGEKTQWYKQSGTWATRVAAAGSYFMCIGKNNKIYYSNTPADSKNQIQWQEIDGLAKEISISDDGQMVVVGMNDALYYSAGVVSGKANWVKLENTWASAVAMGPATAGVVAPQTAVQANLGEGQILCAGSGNSVYSYSGKLPPAINSFKQASGAVKSIAVSSDGQVIGVGMDNAIYYAAGVVNGNLSWVQQAGTKATRLAAGGTNFIHVGTGGSMWFYSGKAANGQMSWAKINGKASDVAIRADGQTIHVGTGNTIYYTPTLNGEKTQWYKQSGTWATRVAAAGSYFMCIGKNNKIYYNNTPADSKNQIQWQLLDGAAKEISISDNGQMVVVGMDDALYYSAGAVSGKANWVKLENTWASAVAMGPAIAGAVAQTTGEVVIPDGFELESGAALAVSSGCDHKGDPTSFVIGADNKVYSFDSYSFNPNPWTKMTDKTSLSDTDVISNFVMISASSTGDLVAVRENGKVVEYDFDEGTAVATVVTPAVTTAATTVTVADTSSVVKAAASSRRTARVSARVSSRARRGATTAPAATITPATTGVVTPAVSTTPAATVATPATVTTASTASTVGKWVEVQGDLPNIKDIAVGDDKYLVAVGGDEKGVYRHTGTTWEKVVPEAKGATGVAVGKDGVIFALNEVGTPLMIQNGKWVDIMAPVKFAKIYAGDAKNVVAIATDGSLWKLDSTKNAFVAMTTKDGKASTGFKDAAINAYGMIFLCDVNTKIYHNEEAGVSAAVAATATVPAAVTAVAGTTTTPATVTPSAKRGTRTAAIRTGKVSRAARASTVGTSTTGATAVRKGAAAKGRGIR